MKDSQIKPSDPDSSRPWKRIAGQEVGEHLAKLENQSSSKTSNEKFTIPLLSKAVELFSRLFIILVHQVSRIANKPMVDIGREYSVSELNERIRMLEEILVRQWTDLKDSDYLTPNEEVKQYIAACHVARQYDRISSQLLASRLGLSHDKAEQLIEQLLDDEVVTESYTITYHDVRRSMIDPTIEQKLSGLHKAAASEAANPAKKH